MNWNRSGANPPPPSTESRIAYSTFSKFIDLRAESIDLTTPAIELVTYKKKVDHSVIIATHIDDCKAQ